MEKTYKDYDFKDIRQLIVDKLESHDFVEYGIYERVSLIDGFMSFPVRHEIKENMSLEGESLPTIMLLGEESGTLYHFALANFVKLT